LRYIGSKVNLLSQLDATIHQRKFDSGTFCDLFSGTGVVAKYFKARYPIISNDLLYFSYVLQYANIKLNTLPDFTKIEKHLRVPVFKYLNNMNIRDLKFIKSPFIAENFSPYLDNERKYFTVENALRIDAIRQSIEDWYVNGIIDLDAQMYLLASLLEAVPSISNIAGTYGAYLKHWDPRTSKTLNLEEIQVVDNGARNEVFNQNANDLVRSVNGRILYIDPPYNARQYLGNYHLLETIAKYDQPTLKGKTGIRNDPTASSDYCKRSLASKRFTELIDRAKFEYIFISYNTEGILSVDELADIVAKNTVKSKMKIYKVPYRRYSRMKVESKPNLFEVVISAVK
jgi:adenine-specific DNA-methyltransferase